MPERHPLPAYSERNLAAIRQHFREAGFTPAEIEARFPSAPVPLAVVLPRALAALRAPTLRRRGQG